MAEAVDFPEATGRLVPPEGQADRVNALSVYAAAPSTAEPSGSVTSCWRLDAEELAEVARTGVLWLSVWGDTHPPLYLTGRRADVLPGATAPT